MKHLIVYSHPYEKSFNHAICETYAQRLRENGHEVRVRDLYAIGFDPVLKAEEIMAGREGRYPEEIRAEQEHVTWAEIITFICPIWWAGLTASLRGYMDRVFANGFAYKETPQGLVKLLTGKKIQLINTIGAPYDVYEKNGYFGAMDKLLDEIAFDFCGLEVIGHKYFGLVTACSNEERQMMLVQVQQLADTFGQAGPEK